MEGDAVGHFGLAGRQEREYSCDHVVTGAQRPLLPVAVMTTWSCPHRNPGDL